MSNAKSSLNSFFLKLKIKQPDYAYESIDDGFLCILALPAIETGEHGFEPTTVTGKHHNRNEEDAETFYSLWAAS